MKKEIICFDLDNVICNTINGDYKKSKPIKKNINLVNKLYNKGFYIKIFTARYMGRSNDNVIKAKKKGLKSSIKQLKEWKVNYNKLIFGKPLFDIMVDDKSLHYKKNWAMELKKYIYEKIRIIN